MTTAPPTVHVLDESRIRTLLPAEEALEVTRQALVAHASQAVDQPDPWHLEVTAPDGGRRGEVHVKGAHLHGASHYAVKLATGFYGNRPLGLPVSGGLSLIADATTGFPTLVALDNGYLTDVRTGAAGALAAQALSRPDAHRVAVIGPGAQAAYQLRALLQVRSPGELVVHGRGPLGREAFAERMRALHTWTVRTTECAEDAVRGADIVVTVTPSREPVLSGEWLAEGTHVTSVGADMEGKRELDASVLRRAELVAADDPGQCLRIGELQYLGRGDAGPSPRIEALGDVLAGRRPGRCGDTAITVADLTGLGTQDAAIAGRLAERYAAESGGRPR
ncbi:ornithine cyclodeaminase family protein [Streptomyces sp. OE57]|uniref:ornithine cyclodeaminase family protein n=1 Tax=Streptomyces lacaronensis TaxID=3379885 RepID=UPI0039B79579